MKLIDRKAYLQRLLAVKNVPDIKVITSISNICFASMTATIISKLDGQVSKMLAL